MPKSREEVARFSEALLGVRGVVRSIIINFLKGNQDNFYSFDEIKNVVEMNKNWKGIELFRAVTSVLTDMEIHGEILAEYINGTMYYAWDNN